MKREKKAVPIEALDEELFLDALHDVTQGLRRKVSHFASSADVLLRESKTFTNKQREYFSGMVSSSDKLQATFNRIFESVVDDALKAANWKKSPNGRLDMAKILESLDDPQRRAKTSAALGKHIRPAFPRDPGLSQRKGLDTGIAKTIGLAWSIRVGALRSELLKHVTVVVGFAESLRTDLNTDRYKDEREFLLYITKDGEELQSALSEDAISGIDKHEKSKVKNTSEQTRKNKTGAISKGSVYTEHTPPIEERKEGEVGNARRIKRAEALEGLKMFLRVHEVPDQQMSEAITDVERVVVKAKIKSHPIWDERPDEVRHLTAPAYLRKIYDFLFVEDGRLTFEDLLREHDAKLVRLCQQYISQRTLRMAADVGDAEGLVFERKDARGRPPKSKKPAPGKRKAPVASARSG